MARLNRVKDNNTNVVHQKKSKLTLLVCINLVLILGLYILLLTR